MSLKTLFGASAVAFSVLMAAPLAQAQQADAAPAGSVSFRMAVMDADGIYANSKAMKNIHEQFAKYQTELQTSIDAEKQTLQKDEEALNRKRSLLAPEAFANERKKFQDRIVTFQRKAQESALKLNQVRAQANTKVQQVLQEIVTDLVKTNGITIVFNAKQTVIADPAMDVSQAVLAELDKRLPSVQVANPMK